MPISTAYAPITYAGDGIANAFVCTFPYQQQTDLVVSTVVVATGVTTLLVLGTDYIVTPTLNSPANTGTVTTTVAVPTGTDLDIARSTPVTQLTTWVPNDPNLSTSTMNAVDKLTMEVQEIVQSGGSLPDSALGAGTATTDTFLRGGSPRQWTNTLIGPIGPFTVPADTTALHIVGQSGDAGYKIVSGATSVGSYRFGVDGSTNPWDFEIFYDPTTPGLGFQTYGNTPFATFDNSGNVGFTGTVNANLFTGAADGSLITTGTIDPNRLGSGSPNSNKVLYGDSVWRIVSGGGGGINTTTTGTFTIAAVTSTQTVPVTSATGIVAGTYLQISDGTHTIIGHVTVVASLNLTFVTDSIVAGTAGNTMAGGAAVQSSTVPGNNTIFVEDGDSGSVAVQTLDFTGSNAGAVGNFVKLFIGNISGPVAQIEGYIDPAALSYNVFGTSGGGAGLVAYNSGSTSTLLHPTAANQVPICTLFAGSPITIGWGLIGAANITPASLTPVLLNATNSLTNGYVPSYDSGTGHFTWVANGGSIPGGGTTAKFFRGDNTFSNALLGPIDIDSSSSTAFRIGVANIFGGPNPVQAYMEPIVSGVPTVLPLQIASQVALGGTQYTTIDTTSLVENLQVNAIARATSFRSTCGPWLEIYELGVGGGATAIDLVNGSYQRFTSLGSSITITLADTTPLPTARRFSSELTLEFNAMSTFDVTWPGTITWANGGTGPTVANSGLTAAGINVIKLIRRQGQTQWVGFVENPVASTPYTDAQARSAVLNSTYLLPSSDGSLTWTIVPGTSAKLTITSSSITNAMLAGSIQTSKIQGISGGGSANAYLNQQGNFTTPSGGGTFTPATSSYVWNNSAGFQTFNGANVFSGALNTFSRTFGTLSSSTASVKVCGLYPQIAMADASGIEIAINDTFDNDFGGLGDVGVGAFSIKHTCTSASGNNGKASTRFDFILNQSLDTLFSIGHSQITASKRLNGGIADSVWLNSWGPDSNYSASPDSNGTTHEFNSGFVRIGECNYGNAWGDFGFLADRNGSNPIVCGLEFTPDWLVYDGVEGDTAFVKYNTTYAISITGAAQNPAQPTHHDARNWIGLLISTGAIVGSTDHASVIGPGTTGSTVGGGGYGIQLHGNPTGNPIGKAINILDYMDYGIDISAATVTQTGTNCPTGGSAIVIAQNQAIKMGTNTFMYWDGTNLKFVKNGASPVTIV